MDGVIYEDRLSHTMKKYTVFLFLFIMSVIDTTLISFEEESHRAAISDGDTMYFRPDEKLLERKIIM